MKNKIVFYIIGLLCALSLSACGSKKASSDNEKQDTNVIEENEIPDTETEDADIDISEKNTEDMTTESVGMDEIVPDTVLTIEEVKRLAEKEDLELTDFDYYLGREYRIAPEEDNATVIFRYIVDEEASLYLDVSYEKENNRIIVAELVNENINLPAGGVKADIRCGLIQEVVDGTISMNSYCKFELPEDLRFGQFSLFNGIFGGNVFLHESQSDDVFLRDDLDICCGGIYFYTSQTVQEANAEFEDNELTNISLLHQGDERLEEETVLDPSVPCYLVLVEREGTKYWMAIFAEPQSPMMYSIELNADYYEKEDILALINSVSFISKAFL